MSARFHIIFESKVNRQAYIISYTINMDRNKVQIRFFQLVCTVTESFLVRERVLVAEALNCSGEIKVFVLLVWKRLRLTADARVLRPLSPIAGPFAVSGWRMLCGLVCI
jgi:hypothetical protein